MQYPEVFYKNYIYRVFELDAIILTKEYIMKFMRLPYVISFQLNLFPLTFYM